ncbi:hypothetical protein ANOM_011760, partial [Aspergillus nomiae NRRL 13137]
TAAPSSETQAASFWVGIDGATSGDAIWQAGVDIYVQNGQPSFAGWYEWYPANSMDIDLEFHFGDVVFASVESTSSSEGVAVIENLTTGKNVTVTASAPAATATLTGQNAEWILEDLAVDGDGLTFVDFGEATFTGCVARPECAKCHNICTASKTAEKRKQLHQNTPPRQLLPDRKGQDQPGFQLAVHEIQQSKGATPGKATIAVSSNPKCARYFATLREAHWKYFGLSSLCRPTLDLTGLFIELETSKANTVYCTLQSRIAMVELGQQYMTSLEDGVSRGWSEEAVRAYISRKVMLDLGMLDEGTDVRTMEGEMLKFIEEFDRSIACALRWQKLYNEIGVPEVFLIGEEPAVSDDREEVPHPDFHCDSDEECHSLLNRLLLPTLALKETCLKLSGVVDMIQRLRGLDQLAVQRIFLAEELERRVTNVLGDTAKPYKNPEGDFDCSNDDDDESMPDIEAC